MAAIISGPARVTVNNRWPADASVSALIQRVPTSLM
jgi:hypothetical protein